MSKKATRASAIGDPFPVNRSEPMVLRFRFLILMLPLIATGWLRADVSKAYFLTALESGKSQRIVVYGTSLTANSAWPADFQKTLRASYQGRARIINSAGGGKDSRWGLANLSNRVLRQRPDTVFIEFAINDALEESHLSIHESMANLTAMITRIRHSLPDCDLVVMIMNPPTGSALEKRPHIAEYRNAYRLVAKKLSCRLINFSPMWKEIISHHPKLWKSYAPDGIHPNNQAAREVILPYLLEKLGHEPPAGS